MDNQSDAIPHSSNQIRAPSRFDVQFCTELKPARIRYCFTHHSQHILYIKFRIKFVKVKRVSKRTHDNFMKSCILLNTYMRTQAKSKFEKDCYKLACVLV